MTSKSNNKRITFKRSRPNPLFQDWLEELHEEAQKKKSKLVPVLKESLNSLKKYPLPLKSGAECIILQGFHKNLCMYLDKCLNVYNHNLNHASNTPSRNQLNHNNTESVSQTTQMYTESVVIQEKLVHNQIESVTKRVSNEAEEISNNLAPLNIDANLISVNKNCHSKKSKFKVYKPTHRSGGFAILITLLEQSLENSPKLSLTKEDLIKKAQKHSEESFTRAKPQSFYTAWSSMTLLVKKGLVRKIRKRKIEYSLTDSGLALATELLNDSKNRPTINDIIFNSEPNKESENINLDCTEQNPSESCTEMNEIIEMNVGSFDIILLIDKNETGGVTKKNDPTIAQFNKYPDLKHEYRNLKVGDFTWVARHKNSNQEFVLPYIIERKRMDDLGSSIKDGRFHEQKFRLKKSGIHNVIYLVENYGNNKYVGLPLQSLMQALANTRVQDGFKVHISDSLTNSARFLAMMTKRLNIKYKDKILKGRNKEPMQDIFTTYEYFNKSSSKTKALTVTETFIKLLLQLKALTAEKALAITNKYSTPYALIKIYEQCDQQEGELLLANLKYGSMSRNVGPVISKSVYQIFYHVGVGDGSW